MKLATFAGAAALAAAGVIAQVTTTTPTDGIVSGKQQYTVHVNASGTTDCNQISGELNQLTSVSEYTCTGFDSDKSLLVTRTSADSDNKAVVHALENVFPGLFEKNDICRIDTTIESGKTAGDQRDFGPTTRVPSSPSKRANPGQAVFEVCDISSVADQNQGKSTLLFNVGIGISFSGGSRCGYIRDHIGGVGGFNCNDNGSGGTSLKFTTYGSGAIVPVRDGAVSDVMDFYGSAITSKSVGGIYDHGSCNLDYPSRKLSVMKRTDPAHSIFNVCDITSESDRANGWIELLFNVDMGTPTLDCAYIQPNDIHPSTWSCDGNGSGGNLLRFTTKRSGSLLAVRDAAVADVLHHFGDAITSSDVGGVHDTAFCTALYPSRKRQVKIARQLPVFDATVKACDITTKSSKNTLLFNVDVDVAFPTDFETMELYCLQLLKSLNNIARWSCVDNGKAGTSLKFVSERDERIVEIRDQVMGEIEDGYLGNVKSTFWSGIKGQGFCDLVQEW